MEAVMNDSNSGSGTDSSNVTSISERKPMTSAQIAAKRLADKAAKSPKKGTVKLSSKPKVAKSPKAAKPAKVKAVKAKAAKKSAPAPKAKAKAAKKVAVKPAKVKTAAKRNASVVKADVKKVTVSIADWKAKLLAQLPDDMNAVQQLSLFVNVGVYSAYRIHAERKGTSQVSLFRDAITYYAAKGFPAVKIDE